MGLTAVIKDDALRMLVQKLDQHLCFFALV